MKDTRTILLLVVSLCLVGTWVYHLYDKSKYGIVPPVEIKKDTTANQTAINDSLRLKYAGTLLQLGSTQIGKDSLNTELTHKITEIDSLRNEINAILNINHITKEDLRKAEEKIQQLQQKMLATNKSNTETKANLVNSSTTSGGTSTQAPIKTTAPDKQETAPSYLNAFNISFRAMQADAKEQSTTKANAAGFFIVSCQLQNSIASFTDAEVYMVFTDPEGNVIQDDQWQAGMFSSKNSGRIPYTRKNNFIYTKGEVKRITVNLKPAEFIQGTYSLQIFHNGSRIGKADLRLN